ncbi:unnamed protein product [Jaminaea pallidilutea]
MPPKKGNKMSLNDFLADEATGKTSWADDMDDLPLAPAPREDRGYGAPRRGGDSFLDSVPDRAERDRMMAAGPPRADLPLPDKPPYTAFLGSLSFDVTEGDIADFFAPHKTVSIRIVSDREGKPRGFGYIEFEELDGLKEALVRNGGNLSGRGVRVGVAEPPKSTGGGFPSSAAEEASQWRRAGPLPPSAGGGAGMDRPGMGRERTGGFGGPRSDGPSGFDQMEVSGSGRSGFGSKFAPSAAPSRDGPGGFRGGPPRGSPSEPVEPSRGEVASDWRTGKPTETAPPQSRRPGFFAGGAGQEGQAGGSARAPSFRGSSATEVDEKYASQERMGFGSKFTATPPDTPRGPRDNVQRKPSGFGASTSGAVSPPPPSAGETAGNWRSARALAPAASTEAKSPPAPAERKKLDLKPRSAVTEATNTDGVESASNSAAATSKASPFGNARPVDNTERERQIEERLQKERAQRAAEEKTKQEKIKADKEKSLRDVPRGPRGDRQQSTSAKSPTGGSGAAAPAAVPAAAVPAAESEKPATPDAEAAATKSRSPPPTGAWGGGRKASGALLTKGAPDASADSAAPAAANGDRATVDGVAEGVEKVAVSEA